MGKAIELKRTSKTVTFTLPNNKKLVAKADADIFDNYIRFDYSWFFKNEKSRGGKDQWYIACSVKHGEKTKTYYLHWLPIGKNKKGMVIDHKNRNPLDNRVKNLRHADYQKNSKNSKKFIVREGSFLYMGLGVTKLDATENRKVRYQCYVDRKYFASALTIKEIKKKIKTKLSKMEK